MKSVLLILILFLSYSCQLKHEPTSRDILESSIPRVSLNVSTIYAWQGDDFKEYEVRKVPVAKEVCKQLNIADSEVPNVSYLFDSEGDKTSYFLALSKMAIGVDSVGFRDMKKVESGSKTISVSVKDMLNDLAGVYIVALYQEKMDDKGNYKIAQVGDVSESIDDKWKFQYLNSEKAFEGEAIVDKEFILHFNNDKTSMFLNQILAEKESPEKEREQIVDSLIMKMIPDDKIEK